MKRETVGKKAIDLLKTCQDDHTAHEQMREQLTDYDKELFACFEENKIKFRSPFYIAVLTRTVPNIPNVFRNTFVARQSCPTPGYDQTVYQCHKDWPEPKFMWVVPCVDFSLYILENLPTLELSLYQLARFVLDYEDGTLLELCKKLNNEDCNTGQLIYEGNNGPQG